MNKRSKIGIVALVVFVIAFLSPAWIVFLAIHGSDNDTKQYGGLQTLLMGFYNLVLIIPALILLIVGIRKQIFYVISLALSVCSILFMSLWALGAL
jgi:hypothetical protein